MWICKEDYENGGTEDLPRLVRLLELLRRDLKRSDFEVIEVVDTVTAPRLGDVVLGYDVSPKGQGDSQLAWGLTIPPALAEDLNPSPESELAKLFFDFCRPQLNEHCLLPTSDIALRVLQCLTAPQAIDPGGYEPYEYSVNGIYLLSKYSMR